MTRNFKKIHDHQLHSKSRETLVKDEHTKDGQHANEWHGLRLERRWHDVATQNKRRWYDQFNC